MKNDKWTYRPYSLTKRLTVIIFIMIYKFEALEAQAHHCNITAYKQSKFNLVYLQKGKELIIPKIIL